MKQQDVQSSSEIGDHSTETSHLVIIGGGLVGLALATMIAKSSLDAKVTIIERRRIQKTSASEEMSDSLGEQSTALSQGSLERLRLYNMLSGLLPHCQPIKKVHVSDQAHLASLKLQAKDCDQPQLGCVIANRILINEWIALAENCCNIEFMEASEVVECKPITNAYLLDIDSHGSISHLKADLLIIADGAQSSLRKRLHINANVHDYHQTALIANVDLSQVHHGIAYERFTSEGPIASLPLINNGGHYRAAVVWVHSNDRIDSIKQLPSKALLHRLQRQLGYRAGHVLSMGDVAYFPLKSVFATEQVRSNLVVVGNASHFLHPVAGQGFNLSIRDIVALVKSLEKTQRIRGKGALGNLSDLQAYQTERHCDQQMTQWTTNFIVKTFSSKRLRHSVLRQMGLLSLDVMPGLKRAVSLQMMGKLAHQG